MGNINEDLGRVLRTIRKHKGLSTAAAARLLGMSESSVGAHERAFRNLNVETLVRIADGYGIPADEILKQALGRGTGTVLATEMLSIGLWGIRAEVDELLEALKPGE